jgi:release factor glutamine methyltransferase
MTSDRIDLGGMPPVARASRPATVGALVEELTTVLRQAARPIEDPTFEAREIVAALYDVPRFWPVTNASTPVDALTYERALFAAAKRGRGAPLAYAVGRACFRHLTLDVDERVLIPRPETEELVELVLERTRNGDEGGIAVDVGTGSGAIALALATEAHFDTVVATDVSLDALAVARANTRLLATSGALRSRVDLLHGSVLSPVRDVGVRARVIVSNPPYIAFDEAAALPSSVRDWEPPLALFSGSEGLDITARLVREAAQVLEPRGLLALEVDSRRASLVAELVAAHASYGEVSVQLDLAGRERFVLATRTLR